MSIARIGIGNVSGGEEILCPSLDMIFDALEQMDGYERNEVVLFNDIDNQLIVSGGYEGFYCICAMVGGESLSIDNRDNPNEMIELVLAGQSVEVTKQSCVSLSEAKDVAKVYFEEGDVVATRYGWIE